MYCIVIFELVLFQCPQLVEFFLSSIRASRWAYFARSECFLYQKEKNCGVEQTKVLDVSFVCAVYKCQ